MRDVTLYLDETGQFVQPARAPTAIGLRLVGGLLLPGDPATLDATLGPRVRRAFSPWRGSLHATELRNPFVLACHALSLPPEQVPSRLRAGLDQVRRAPPHRRVAAFRAAAAGALSSWLDDQVDRIFRRVAALVSPASPSGEHPLLLAAVEHDTSPSGTRYPAMLAEVIRVALWALRAGPADDPVTLHVVAEARSDLRAPPDLSALGSEPSPRRRPVVFASTTPVILAGDVECPGLVLADVLLYHLREQGRAPSTPLSPAAAERFDRACFQDLLASDLGLDLPPPLVTGGPPVEILRAVAAGTLDRDTARARLRPETLDALDGTVRASWESAARLLEGWP